MSDVTRILSQIDAGDPAATSQLLTLVYDELRKLAKARLSQEQPGQTLQATALVHEAYLRLVDPDSAAQWDSRAHFFAAAAEAMRRLLVEQARRRHSRKWGGKRQRVELDDAQALALAPSDEVLDVADALTKLEAEDPQAAQLVKLRYFTGLSLTEAAALLGISRTSAYQQWSYARAWLRCALRNNGPELAE
jgi:RNA polymerase sigma factor (TIGR02999 family)